LSQFWLSFYSVYIQFQLTDPTLVLTQNKELFVWGYNCFGQTGNGGEGLFELTPIKLNALNNEKVIVISRG
jgi:hypothetical protein